MRKSKWSLYLGKIAGIKVFVHWTFLVLIFWIAISGFTHGQSFSEIFYTIGFILTVFVCVTLHELGHAVIAKRYQCVTQRIILLPIGGLAQMEKLPEEPCQEMKVALAGPLVNLIISALLYFTVIYGTGMPHFHELTKISAENFFMNLLIVNVFLAVFNLIPAFPMDGGRVLRALLSFKYERYKATRIAASVGQFIAIIFVFIGLFYNPMLVFIGAFIFIGAQIEAEFYQSRFFLHGFKVKDVLMHEYHVLNVSDPLSKAVNELLDVQATGFLVFDNDQVAGTLNRDEIIKALTHYGKEVPIGEVMNKDFEIIEAEESLEKVYASMRIKSSALYPVMENGTLKGVVDLDNISEFILVHAAEEKFEKHKQAEMNTLAHN